MIARRKILGLMAAAALPGALRAQGFAGLSADAEGFTLPQPDPNFVFPRDHGPHPDFRIEWWYVTANLRGADGADYGIQWTLFRTALRPEAPGAEAAGWASPQVWFAHAGLTTAARHFAAQTFARGGIGQAGVTTAPFDAWINDWRMRTPAGADMADAFDRLDVAARAPDFGYALEMRAEGPLLFQGQGGYSVKSPRGQASYYYSQPHCRVTGRLDLPGGPVEVTGRAWLDREWSSQPLAESQTGWDWFSLHLSDGAKLMVYRLRDSAGPDYVPGAWVAPDGSARYIPDGALILEPLDHATVAGRRIPVDWRITWDAGGLDIVTRPLNPQSWMGLNVPYWEGPVFVSGSHDGIGYLEMTGYA